MIKRKSISFAAIMILALVAAITRAQPVGRAGALAGRINLPFTVNDNSGNQWIIQQQGILRMQGNSPVFGQAAALQVNGNPLVAQGNQATQDPKTGEIIFDNLRGGNVVITRRILVNRIEGSVRYIDIFKNTNQQDQSIAVQLSSNYNFGVQQAQPVYDPTNKERTIGAALMMQNGRAVYEMFAGKGAKSPPQINPQPNNNMLQAVIQLTVPAGKQIALLHVHGTSATAESAAQAIITYKESKAIADLPIDLRKSIVNIAGMQAVGDREVLRGDLLDIIELRDFNQVKGTIAESKYNLQTFYGPVELPADRVVGIISAGEFGSRELLITSDGEVFGGVLDKASIAIELSTGQKTSVPLSQISRVGYRRRSGEPEETPQDKPIVALRSGERLMIAMPESPIEVMTTLGLLKLPPKAIAGIDFQSEDRIVPEIRLTDGSRFSGLATADTFTFQLAGAASQQKVTITAATIERISFTNTMAEIDEDDTPLLRLTNRDQFVGSLSGQLQLQTRFDKIALNGASLRSLTHAPQTPLDVQATLWDQTTFGGQLREPVISCELVSGITINVPVALLQNYNNPKSRPSDAVADRIKEIVQQLSADDWKKREQAESQLMSMGTDIVPVLKELVASQTPEARQRIESILSQLDAKKKAD